MKFRKLNLNMRPMARSGIICAIKKCGKHLRRSVNLVKLQASACNFTNSNAPPSVFFTFF